jgi:hypothetical protein
MNRYLERIQYHLNNGVGVNSERYFSTGTCLHFVSQNGQHANPNHQSLIGYTPLHATIINKKIECAKLLLEHGANPNLQTQIKSYPGYIPYYSVKMISGFFDLVARLLIGRSLRGKIQT